MERAPLSLIEINSLIKKVVKENLGSCWLTAEIGELTINYSGHCYLEFVQKDEKSEKLIARARGTIWANTFRMIKPYFETTTGRPFCEGLKVMVKVSPEYHEVYGLSLNVLDIEPTYTVGEIVVRKQKILEKLKNEGVINMNKELDMSYIPHRIAIISSKTAAGYEDFVDQLTSNSHNFRFYIKLFPAVMQGNEAESSIIKQLDKIYQHTDNFDAVVIIRGGGAQADLDCFNSYWLAYNITQFPLPVLTGIGHEQDDSVVDMVAHTRLKTPTAVAEHLIDSLVVVESDLLETEEQIVDVTREIINNNRDKLKDFAYSLNKEIHTIILKENKKLSGVYSTYILSTRYKLSNQKVKLVRCMASLEQKENLYLSKKSELLRTEIHQMKSKLKLKFAGLNYNLLSFNQAIELHSPSTILGKGYSITTHNGKIVKDGSKLSHGDEIKTVYFKGKTNSKIL